jgi:hypothetical protein
MRAGTSLREQLHASIEHCDLCVFIATRNSVQSDWCSAELGAFWGSKKRVIVYVADDSLTDEDIPQQFKGDIWHRKIRDIVRDVKELLKDAVKKHQVEKQRETSPTRVADISVGALLDLIRSVLNERSLVPFSETMDRLAALVLSKTKKGGLELSPDFAASVKPYLARLTGEPMESLKTKGQGTWKNGFSMQTTTGHWIGYSCDESTYAHGDVEVHSGCLIIHVSSDLVDACAIVSAVSEVGVKQPIEYTIGEIVAQEGALLPGTMDRLGGFIIASNSP